MVLYEFRAPSALHTLYAHKKNKPITKIITDTISLMNHQTECSGIFQIDFLLPLFIVNNRIKTNTTLKKAKSDYWIRLELIIDSTSYMTYKSSLLAFFLYK